MQQLFILASLLVLPVTLPAQKPISLFEKVSETLQHLSSLQYDSYREINNYEDNYFAKNKGTAYFEFDNSKTGELSRCQLRSEKMTQIFNGAEFFSLYENEKTYEGGRNNASALRHLSLFYNSVATLRLALPVIARDTTIYKSVKDTVLDGRSYHLLKFHLHKKTLEFPFGFSSFEADVTRFYSLLVDKNTSLPYMIIDQNSLMKDRYHTKTIFTNMQTEPVSPSSGSWFISDYSEYSLKKKEDQKPLISIGAQLPEWTLAQISSKDSVSLTDLKGKKIMMEFWIKNCGYCMAAFPGMKKLQQQYGNTANIISVNAYEEKKDVEFFFNRENPGYKMLYGGEKLANTLGIFAYPIIVIADGDGKVIYTGVGFNPQEIEAVLAK